MTPQKKAARLAAKAPPKSAPYTPPAPAPVAAAPAPAAAVSDSAPAAAASKPLTAAEMAASVHSSQAPGMSTGENDKTAGKMGASGIGSGIRLEGVGAVSTTIVLALGPQHITTCTET